MGETVDQDEPGEAPIVEQGVAAEPCDVNAEPMLTREPERRLELFEAAGLHGSDDVANRPRPLGWSAPKGTSRDRDEQN